VPLFEMTREDLVECKPVTFTHLEIKERVGLQHVLRDHIEVLGEDLRLIAEEYGDWEDARRRIDLLALDKQRRSVVIELKRTESGGHMELQALRYAAMVSAMTFERLSMRMRRTSPSGDCLMRTKQSSGSESSSRFRQMRKLRSHQMSASS